MTPSTGARWRATGLVVLVPVLVMVALGQVGVEGFGQPWDWLTLLAVWFVGIVSIWTFNRA
jgi:hypothetical protein